MDSVRTLVAAALCLCTLAACTSTTYVSPTPTPAPTPRPTATPVRPEIAVPASIDSTGAADASSALNAWVNTVPDGSTIVFRAGGYYRMDRSLAINARHNLTFEGNGATLKSNGDFHEYSSVFQVFGCTGIVIRNINLVGNSPTPGVYIPRQEGAHGVQIVMGSNIEVVNATISNVYGDGANTDYWTDGVWVHNSTINRPGRAGFVVLAGKNITVENNLFFNESNTSAILDIEPYEADGGVINFKFLDNTITGNDFYFAANGGNVLTDIIISGNTATTGTIRGLIRAASPRPQRVTITNNTALGSAVSFDPDTMGHGGLELRHIDGLTVTGNHVPLWSGQLASIIDCTDVTYSR